MKTRPVSGVSSAQATSRFRRGCLLVTGRNRERRCKNPERVNPFFDKVKAAKERADRFKEAFWSHASAALTRTSAPQTPLLETLAYVARRTDFIEVPERAIYIFSDLIQNSAVADFYRAVPTVEAADADLHAVHLDFRAARVFLTQAARRSLWSTRPRVAEFWDAWLTSHNGRPRWDLELPP